MKRTTILLAIAAAAVLSLPLHAEEEGEVETKLREALRGSMLQVRDAQARTAEMESKVVLSEKETAKTKKELTTLQATMVDERTAAANQAAELRSALEESATRITALEAQVAKWDSDYKQSTARALKAENGLAHAKARIGTLERLAAEQQVKNIEMKQTADEILDRYQRHGLGSTILAREPFISVNRAKLQTIMQDLETRIRAATIVPKTTP
jgi:chromosome segregation ATPase